jgi:hypothetical protein
MCQNLFVQKNFRQNISSKQVSKSFWRFFAVQILIQIGLKKNPDLKSEIQIKAGSESEIHISIRISIFC